MISAGSDGSLETYRETLFRFSPLVNRAATVIPGHARRSPASARGDPCRGPRLPRRAGRRCGGALRTGVARPPTRSTKRDVASVSSGLGLPDGPGDREARHEDVRERPDRERVDDGADADGAAERPADREHGQLDARCARRGSRARAPPARSSARRAGRGRGPRRCRRRSRRRSGVRRRSAARCARRAVRRGYRREDQVDHRADEQDVEDRAEPGTLAQRDPQQRARRRRR